MRNMDIVTSLRFENADGVSDDNQVPCLIRKKFPPLGNATCCKSSLHVL